MKSYVHTPTYNDDGTPRLDDNGDPIMIVTVEEIADVLPDEVFPVLESSQPTKAELIEQVQLLMAQINSLKE